MVSKRIAIFGSGLSAAFVLAACNDAGWQTDIYTDRPFTTDLPELAHVILKWIPAGVELTPYSISHFSRGTLQDYLKRMGRENDPNAKTTFPPDGRNEFTAYDPKEVLKKLWPKDAAITYGKFSEQEIESIAAEHVWSFVTFPMHRSQPNDLVFYWSYTLAHSNLSLPNIAIYNGRTDLPWTRLTQYWNIMSWEYSHMEYPDDKPPPRPSVWAEPKRIADIAIGVPEYTSPIPKVTMVGRWARWRKDVLSHDGYKQAMEILKEL